MSAETTLTPDVHELAKLLAREQAAQMGLTISELIKALQPARKERAEAAQRVTLTTVSLEQAVITSPGAQAQQLVGNGRIEQRARLTLWCNTGAVVYIATDKGGLTSEQTRIQLVPLVPLVFLNCSQLFAFSTDAGTARVTLVVEEYDE